MITGFLHRAARFAWLLPGFILWAAFPPMAEGLDCLFALAPVLWIARRGDAKRSFKLWYLTGCVYWGATLMWMPAIIKNGGPWPLVVLGWFALAAYCALFFGAFGFVNARYWRWVRKSQAYWPRLVGLLLVEPILWAGLELLRSRLFGGFAWNQLGVVPANCGFGAPAAWGGVYLLSAVVILINGTVASIAERVLAPIFDKFAPKPVPNWARSVETFLPFLLIGGIYSLPVQPSTSNLQHSLTVGLVQRNFPCCFQEKDVDPYEVYRKLLEPLAPLKPDLIVLPESALAEFGPIDRPGVIRFARYVYATTGASVLAGGTRYGEGKTIYNSAVLYPAEELARRDALPASQVYDKVHLVPFGEFIPGDKIFPALQKLAPVGSCTSGKVKLLYLPISDFRLQIANTDNSSTNLQPPTFNHQPSTTNLQPSTTNHQPSTTNHQPSTTNLQPLPLAVSICYEDTDSALIRDFARRGARLLVFITNDSWFSGSDETVQHAWQARVRAIETGLPVVRVGNSGVSGILFPDGKAEWLNAAEGRPLVDAPGTMLEHLDVSPRPQTPYVRFGDGPLGLLFALLILLQILIEYREHYEKRRIVSM